MIVVRVELHSAITGRVTELARMILGNLSGEGRRRDYHVQILRGRSRETLDRRTVQKTGLVLNHPSAAQHVWNLVAKALMTTGYGGR